MLLLISAIFVAEANPVDMRTSQEVAMKFVNANARTPLRGMDELQLATTYNISRGDAAFHIFNTPTGFVIVSADDSAYPILGYSDEGRQFDVNNIPIQLQDVLQEYVEQIQYAVENHHVADERTAEQWRLVQTTGRLSNNRDNTQVGPLLTTTWDQGQYYNALCPEDANGPDGHCVTGCVATAMAQIINYWEYPTHGRGTHSYESNYGTLSVNFDSVMYDYSNMPDTLSSECTDEEINAVAKLISACGVAVNMGYSAVESSAYDQEARAALINFFKYSPDLSFAEKDFFSTEEWNNMLRAELDASRVIYYSGQGTGGHAFVCDGYNSDGYYHFNFGWSGNGNSWYLLDAVYPLGMDFSISQAAILGIVPDANGDVILGQMDGTSTFIVEEPLEFYHIMGHNLYEGYNYGNPCNNTVNIILSDETNQMVVDIMEYEDQNLTINDGNGAWLRSLSGGDNNDLSPVVSSSNAISLIYSGNLFYAGFQLSISQNNGCRMVSDILSSVDITTVHLAWTENGSATQWQIEYGEEGFSHGEGTTIVSSTESATIANLDNLKKYDFYIRSCCDAGQYGLWNKVSVMIEAYWHDVVNTQPEDYLVVDDTVYISSAESLTWWAKNGCTHNVVFNANIDLAGYKWKPVDVYADIVIDGQNHVIYNLFSHEVYSSSLIRHFFHGVICNLGVEDFDVVSELSGAAALCCAFYGTMFNCHVKDGRVKGKYKAGGLVCDAVDCNIFNCYAEAMVDGYFGYGDHLGILIGEASRSNIRNCYTYNPNTYVSNYPPHYAGIVSFASEGQITNCYSLDAPSGLVGRSYGTTYCADTSSFYGNDLEWTLRHPVTFGDLQVDDLCQALNLGVAELNESGLKLWETDNQYLNNGYPVFGTTYQVTCPNVSNIEINNIITSQGNAVMISWTADPEETEWQIKYRRHDLSTDAVIMNTTNNPVVLFDIPLTFEYDFNIRAVCGVSDYSGWSPTVTKVIDKPYWTDIVTSRPDGYVEDSDGNVYISTAEGLSWLSSESNGINTSPIDFDDKQVYLTNDIDISQYSWHPISTINTFSGSFDGCGHKISGIYINSNDFYDCGLFGLYYGDTLQNIIMDGGLVKNCNWDVNNSRTGSVVGLIQGETTMVNCHSSVDVEGMDQVGGLVGEMRSSVINCSATGNVTGRGLCGGLIGFAYGDIQIDNCYATGDIIYKNSDAGAWALGGLIGQAQFIHAHNCYSTGEIIYSGGFEFVGKLIGAFDITGDGAYLYGQVDNTMPNMFGSGFMLNYQVNCQDTARFTVAGVLDNVVTIGENSYTDLLAALNAWVDANNTEGQYRHWVADTAMVNGGFPIFEELPAFEIAATASPAEGGTVAGAGTYQQGQLCILIATPNEGYIFINWKKDSEEVSTEAIYSFTVTEAADYVANFELDTYTITATANPEAGGTVDGAGTYDHGATATLTATANEGYTFTNWTQNGEEVSTEGIYSFTVTEAGDYVANFELNTYAITVTANPEVGGEVTGAGIYNHGETATLTATTNEGYTFINWTQGGEVVSSEATYSFTVTEAGDYVANFELNSYEITVTANPTEGGEVAGAGTYSHGETATLTATANEGYTFINWTQGGDEVSTEATYSFTVTEALAFVANFELVAITQTTNFTSGWTWWSTFIETSEADVLGQLKDGLGASGQIIKSQNQSIMQMGNSWFGTLNMTNENGYMVKANAEVSVDITAPAAIPENHAITLSPGWTWVGYPCAEAVNINEALANLTPQANDVMKSQQATAMFMAGQWRGALGTLTPGMGLMYRSNSGEAVTFNYAAPTRTGEMEANDLETHWQANYTAYPTNMTVLATIELDGEEINTGNYELATFADGECRGAVRMMYVEPIDRHFALLTIAGDEASELHFALYDTGKGEEYHNAAETLTFEKDAVIGEADAPFIVRFRSTGIDEWAGSLHIFPNPVEHGQTVSLGFADTEAGTVQVDIVNALGTVVETWRAMSLQSITAPETAGVYTLRVTVESKGSCYRKLVVR